MAEVTYASHPQQTEIIYIYIIFILRVRLKIPAEVCQKLLSSNFRTGLKNNVFIKSFYYFCYKENKFRVIVIFTRLTSRCFVMKISVINKQSVNWHAQIQLCLCNFTFITIEGEYILHLPCGSVGRDRVKKVGRTLLFTLSLVSSRFSFICRSTIYHWVTDWLVLLSLMQT